MFVLLWYCASALGNYSPHGHTYCVTTPQQSEPPASQKRSKGSPHGLLTTRGNRCCAFTSQSPFNTADGPFPSSWYSLPCTVSPKPDRLDNSAPPQFKDKKPPPHRVRGPHRRNPFYLEGTSYGAGSQGKGGQQRVATKPGDPAPRHQRF